MGSLSKKKIMQRFISSVMYDLIYVNTLSSLVYNKLFSVLFLSGARPGRGYQARRPGGGARSPEEPH